jgi:hypothetical protein
MKGMLKGVAALALATMFAASSAQAQAKFGVAGTAMFHLDPSGGGTPLGGMALVGFHKADMPIGFRVDGTVVHKGETNILGTADITYAFKTAESSMFHPYLLAGGGVYHFGGPFSTTKPMAKAGVGFDYNMANSKLTLFAEATFNLVFLGSGNGTLKDLQTNLGVKFGG